MTDGTMNLTVARSEKSVWDQPGFAASLSTYDQDRWVAAATGTGMMMIGVRRGGFAGGLIAMLGATLTVRAAMGRRDVCVARTWINDALQHRGWLARDIVADESDQSFPAS